MKWNNRKGSGDVQIECPTCKKTFVAVKCNHRTYCSGDCYHKDRKLSVPFSKTLKGKYNSYKKTAKARGHKFELSIEDFGKCWQKPCHYCGGDIDTIGVDRVDSNEGYVISNIVSCCKKCNIMKLNHSESDFYDHLAKILEHKKEKKKYSLFIGRWQPPHLGHKTIIESVLNEGKNVLIACRITEREEKNPYIFIERRNKLRQMFPDTFRVQIIPIQDIEEVVYGRDVGWGIREIKVSSDIQKISATDERKKMNMAKQIFTGGNFSSGTRVIQFLLRQTHNIHVTKLDDPWGDMDYELGFSKRPTFAQRVLSGERPEFPGLPLREPFALKNPGFMFCIPYLRELFPNSKFILVVRNGLDQILCNNRCLMERVEQFFGLEQTDFLKKEMELWNNSYKKAVEDRPDLIIRLEDLVYDTKNTIKRIVDLVQIPWPDISMIKKPESMGRHKQNRIVTLGQDVTKSLETIEHKYDPAMIPDLYKVGKEMMDYFGYGI